MCFPGRPTKRFLLYHSQSSQASPSHGSVPQARFQRRHIMIPAGMYTSTLTQWASLPNPSAPPKAYTR